MRLTHKLTLAFLLVSLVAIGLAAVFVWRTTSTQFDRYMVNQRQAEFINVVTEYYQVNGHWKGVDIALRSQGLLPPLSQPSSPPPDPQPFVLVDQGRTVIISGGDYQSGQKVQKGVLAKGINIDINGLVVGTILNTGERPIPSVFEEKYITGVNQSLLLAAIGGTAISLLLGLLTSRSLTRPVRDLMNATKAMAEGNLEQPVPVRSSDELGELAQSFNQMSTDLSRANQSRRQMTADIAHDLRNPLMVIGGYLESLQDGKLKPTPERIETMQVEVRHLQHLVDDLRTLSLAEAGDLILRRQPIAPGVLLERVAKAYEHQAGQKKINLIIKVEPQLDDLFIDPERMEQVLGNLVSNALRYTPESGMIFLTANKGNGGLRLSVKDNGTGIDLEMLPHIFERSFRGDPSRSGSESGLGLAIARSIVELHGGIIQVESDQTGSEFIIFF